MTDLRKTAEQALEYLNKVSDWDTTYPIGKAKEELRQALAQPERKWVGLTDDERKQIVSYINDPVAWVPAVEAKLKQKNT